MIGLQEDTLPPPEGVELLWEGVEQTQRSAGGHDSSEGLLGAAEWLVPVQEQGRRETEHKQMEHTDWEPLVAVVVVHRHLQTAGVG